MAHLPKRPMPEHNIINQILFLTYCFNPHNFYLHETYWLKYFKIQNEYEYYKALIIGTLNLILNFQTDFTVHVKIY